ncbi:hypothetical protein BSKO_09883 [Bryopsis sp. KO-2023]|nr:hypothetical protein BSKO_09883 [Bryopsis sp. KO-2023]
MASFGWLVVFQALLCLASAQKFCDGDCYDLMGLTQRATKEDIKKAYKKFSLQYHPDRDPGEAGIAKFKKIAQAYEVLSSEKRRRKYDYAIKNPGWVDGDGDFVGMTGAVDGKITFVILLGSMGVIAFIAIKFLNVQDLFEKPKKLAKKGKKSKNGSAKAE